MAGMNSLTLALLQSQLGNLPPPAPAAAPPPAFNPGAALGWPGPQAAPPPPVYLPGASYGGAPAVALSGGEGLDFNKVMENIGAAIAPTVMMGQPDLSKPTAAPTGPSEEDAAIRAAYSALIGTPTDYSGMDGTTTIQGMPFPDLSALGGGGVSAPMIPLPPDLQAPDFSAARAALERARPRDLGLEGESETDGMLRGLAEAASQIGPDTPLAQTILNIGAGMLGGVTTARSLNRKDQVEAERERARYEMEVAGVDAREAEIRANIAAENAKRRLDTIARNVENEFQARARNADINARRFGYSLDYARAQAPEVSISEDGRTMVTRTFHPETGQTTITREGFEKLAELQDRMQFLKDSGITPTEAAADLYNTPGFSKETRLSAALLTLAPRLDQSVLGGAYDNYLKVRQQDMQKEMMSLGVGQLSPLQEQNVDLRLLRRMLADPGELGTALQRKVVEMFRSGELNGQ